jgi:hypothetical protein
MFSLAGKALAAFDKQCSTGRYFWRAARIEFA